MERIVVDIILKETIMACDVIIGYTYGLYIESDDGLQKSQL